MHIKILIPSLLIFIFSSIANADEASLKKSLAPYFPNEKIEILKKIPSLQLYEITIGDQIFYVDEKAKYFFSGHLFDLKNEKNLTEERLQEIRSARKVDINSLPIEYAIQETKGNGKRKLVIFSDGLDVEKISQLQVLFDGRVRVSFGWGTLLTNDFRGLVPDDALKPFSLVCKVVNADGRPTVKLSDNPNVSYKQFGNTVVVDVIQYLIKELINQKFL
mgnify:CR=1 FL=1